jgi:hypothetical protein
MYCLTEDLDSRTGDEEPLVNAAIDWGRGVVGFLWDGFEPGAIYSVGRARVGYVGKADFTTLLLASDKAFPGIAALADDFLSILLVLAFAAEGKLVLRFAIWDLVDAEPLVGSSQQARKVTFDVFDVIELRREGIIDVDDDDLPVGLFLVQQGHHTKDLDLFDLTGVTNQFSDFTDIKRVVVAFGFGLGVNDIGIFPGLSSRN